MPEKRIMALFFKKRAKTENKFEGNLDILRKMVWDRMRSLF
jgi:hypothetical protein